MADRSVVVDGNPQWSLAKGGPFPRPAVVVRMFIRGGNSGGFSLPKLFTFNQHSSNSTPPATRWTYYIPKINKDTFFTFIRNPANLSHFRNNHHDITEGGCSLTGSDVREAAFSAGKWRSSRFADITCILSVQLSTYRTPEPATRLDSTIVFSEANKLMCLALSVAKTWQNNTHTHARNQDDESDVVQFHENARAPHSQYNQPRDEPTTSQAS